MQVAKNIVLAGVGNVAIMDSTPCKEHAAPSFLLTTDAAGDDRCGARRLRPPAAPGCPIPRAAAIASGVRCGAERAPRLASSRASGSSTSKPLRRASQAPRARLTPAPVMPQRGRGCSQGAPSHEPAGQCERETGR